MNTLLFHFLYIKSALCVFSLGVFEVCLGNIRTGGAYLPTILEIITALFTVIATLISWTAMRIARDAARDSLRPYLRSASSLNFDQNTKDRFWMEVCNDGSGPLYDLSVTNIPDVTINSNKVQQFMSKGNCMQVRVPLSSANLLVIKKELVFRYGDNYGRVFETTVTFGFEQDKPEDSSHLTVTATLKQKMVKD